MLCEDETAGLQHALKKEKVLAMADNILLRNFKILIEREPILSSLGIAF